MTVPNASLSFTPRELTSFHELLTTALDHFPYAAIHRDPPTLPQLPVVLTSGEMGYEIYYEYHHSIYEGIPVIAGGMIELSIDQHKEPTVTAAFGLCFNGDWDTASHIPASLLKPHHAIQGDYDIEERTWTLYIG
jgi:hypothetical protein